MLRFDRILTSTFGGRRRISKGNENATARQLERTSADCLEFADSVNINSHVRSMDCRWLGCWWHVRIVQSAESAGAAG